MRRVRHGARSVRCGHRQAIRTCSHSSNRYIRPWKPGRERKTQAVAPVGLRLQDKGYGATRFELAERDFRGAIELARTMNAKSPELRALTSLARMLAKQGKRDEARTMLAEIYGWFTEGFDTADLKDAKALLDELNA